MSRLTTGALAMGALMYSCTAFAQGFIPASPLNELTPPNSIPGIVHPIQSSDSFRVNELEERVRQLNGKVEELNFLLLQLQEKFRKMEEDNEGRFQEIEDKLSALEGDAGTAVSNNSAVGGSDRLGKPKSSGTDKVPDAKPAESQAAKKSLEPRALGTLIFDKDGNVIDSGSDDRKKLDGLPGLFNNPSQGSVEAAEFGATPKEVFEVGKRAYDARDYKKSQQAFSAHLKAWPKDPEAGIVKYYLGESYFWQKEYYYAVDAHLDAHNNYPEAETASGQPIGTWACTRRPEPTRSCLRHLCRGA